jgi:hypothetical protein
MSQPFHMLVYRMIDDTIRWRLDISSPQVMLRAAAGERTRLASWHRGAGKAADEKRSLSRLIIILPTRNVLLPYSSHIRVIYRRFSPLCRSAMLRGCSRGRVICRTIGLCSIGLLYPHLMHCLPLIELPSPSFSIVLDSFPTGLHTVVRISIQPTVACPPTRR